MRILKLRLLAVALFASALAGCVTVENKLTKADVATFKLVDTKVSVAPDAKITWYEPLQAYAATKKIPDEQYADFIKTEDAKAHLNGLITGKVKGAMEKHMAGALNGSRPVRIEVVVTQFIIPTAAQRVIIGGSNMMTADVNLVDAKSGAVILAYPKFTWAVQAGQGIGGVIAQAIVDSTIQPSTDSLIEQHAMFYKIWLINDAKKA
jgi:hypothetical protein